METDAIVSLKKLLTPRQDPISKLALNRGYSSPLSVIPITFSVMGIMDKKSLGLPLSSIKSVTI